MKRNALDIFFDDWNTTVQNLVIFNIQTIFSILIIKFVTNCISVNSLIHFWQINPFYTHWKNTLVFRWYNMEIALNGSNALCEKCPYSVFFWSVFSCIRTKYGEIQSISPYSVRLRENTDQKNSEYGHFSCSDGSLWLLSSYLNFRLSKIDSVSQFLF